MSYQAHTATNEKPVPHDRYTEAGIISLALADAGSLFKIREAGVVEEFFFSEIAATVYGLICELSDNGSHPTAFELIRRLKTLPNSGDYLSYVTKATTEFLPTEFTDRYTRQLIDLHKRRQLVAMAQRLAQLAYDDKLTSDVGLTYAFDEAERIEQSISPTNILDGVGLEKTMREYYKQAPNKKKGTPFYIGALDKVTYGTHLGELTLIRAEPGSGKSAFLQQVCYRRAVEKERAQLYLTINDMNARQMYNRIMQQLTGVSSIALTYGVFTDKDRFNHWNKIDAELKKLPGMRFYICEDGNISSTNLRRVVKAILRREETLDVYVDYLQQFQDEGEVYNRTAEISRNILYVAHKLTDQASGEPRVSVTAISSLNKAGDMFGAKQLEHDAENVWLLKNEKAKEKATSVEEKSGKAIVVIEKQRNRISGLEVPLYWNAPFARFDEYTEQDK